MNRVGINVVLGTFWIIVAIWMLLNSGGSAENQMCAAILIILGVMFYWAAYKVYTTPSTRLKKKQNLIQRMSNPNYKNTMSKKSKK